MKSERAAFPALGIDTVAKLTPEVCSKLRSQGISFVVRYLGSMSQQEVADILAAGLAIMPVTYSRKAGWEPTPEMGRVDGIAAVTRAQHLGIPAGTTVWLDLEGCVGPASATTLWANAWAEQVSAAGYEPGLYVGAQPGGLDAAGLYALRVKRYWRSCSRVPEPSGCGWCMMQLTPFNADLCGVTVDVDVICEDWRGRRPTWAVQGG